MNANEPEWSTLLFPNGGDIGEVMVGSGSNTLAMLAVGTAGMALISNGAGNQVFWGKILLNSSLYVSGTLPTGNGGTGASTFTLGSVVFAGASGVYTQDNSNFFWDNTNNRLGVGTASPRDTLHVVGQADVTHTAISPDEHALEVEVDAAGHGDIKAVDITYTTGPLATGEDTEAILVNIDESSAGGGDVFGLEVIGTEGSANLYGLKAAALINPVLQLSGTFVDMDSALVKTTNRLTEFLNAGNDIVFFVDLNDTVTIGDAAKFEELEFLLATTASGPGVKPTFEFSTGSGTWDDFTPTDGTDGMRHTGVIVWEDSDIPGWNTGVGTEYLIRIKRNQVALTTSPIESKVQIAAVVEFSWLKDGKIKALTLQSTQTTGTAPLTVASTTLVANLNADLLDGVHAAAFSDVAWVGAWSGV